MSHGGNFNGPDWFLWEVVLTLLLPERLGEESALLLYPLLQAPLPQAKVSEGGQGEPPLLLPQVPVGGDQPWQTQPTVSKGRSPLQGEEA